MHAHLLLMAAGIAACLGAGPVNAMHLGTIGPTYEIAEQDLLQQIQARLQQLAVNGGLERLQAQVRVRVQDTARHPAPVAGLRVAQAYRAFDFDPSVVLDRNLFDAQGHLLFAAGTRRNPLSVVPMSSRLLFFDARDRQQVARAQTVVAQYRDHVKPILVGGSPLDLAKSWGRPVYFDQHGSLVQRLGIQAVPAMVSQQGLVLRIEELVP